MGALPEPAPRTEAGTREEAPAYIRSDGAARAIGTASAPASAAADRSRPHRSGVPELSEVSGA